MKVNVSKEELMKGLQMVVPIIGTKITLPVLAHFLFATENGKIKLCKQLTGCLERTIYVMF